jgi:GNAT superfamily N-acetyltransferase
MPAIVYDTLPLEEIHQVRPLWEGLRIFTREITTHFKTYYQNLDFDERIRKFFKPGMRVQIDIAVDSASGRIAGYALASIDPAGTGELDSFFVLQDYRRLGIGEQLLVRSIGWMKQQGPKEMMILTAFENREVLALYERLGFFPRLIQLFGK